MFFICFEILALQERQWEPGAQSTSGSSGEAMLPENKRVAPSERIWQSRLISWVLSRCLLLANQLLWC